MSRTATRVIAIVYGISLVIAYFAHRPPQWLDRVEVSIHGERTARLFGHQVRWAIDVRRDQREAPKSTHPWQGRVINGFLVVPLLGTAAPYMHTRPTIVPLVRMAVDTAGRSER